jgi:hypothetical protein
LIDEQCTGFRDALHHTVELSSKAADFIVPFEVKACGQILTLAD